MFLPVFCHSLFAYLIRWLDNIEIFKTFFLKPFFQGDFFYFGCLFSHSGGKWRLGMNLNPSDGHIMDYLTGWEEGKDIGTSGEALVKDYINNTVWNMPVTNIAIVRHQKVFKERFYLFFLETFSANLTCHQIYFLLKKA